MNALEKWIANRSDAIDGLQNLEESFYRGVDVPDTNDNEEALALLGQAMEVAFKAAYAFLDEGRPE